MSTTANPASVESALARLTTELRTDTPAFLDALAALEQSSSAGESCSSLRANLRSTVENKSLDTIERFVSQLSSLASTIESLDNGADELVAVCDKAKRRIDEGDSTSTFFKQVEALASEKERKKTLLEQTETFISQHELSAKDEAALARGLASDDASSAVAAGASPVDPRASKAFFQALAHLDVLQKRTQDMLAQAGPNTLLAVELQDALSSKQRLASERLFKWCATQCSEADVLIDAWDSAVMASLAVEDADAPSSSSGTRDDDMDAADDVDEDEGDRRGGRSPVLSTARVLLRGLRYLRRHEPAYFRSCQNAAITPLRSAFLRKFLTALTGLDSSSSGGSRSGRGGAGGSSSGGGRPLDLLAHDPARHVGDMLAWLHLAFAEQREALAGLFGKDSSPAAIAAADDIDDSGDKGESDDDTLTRPLPLHAMLGQVTQGVTRPLCSRIEQTATGQASQAGALVTAFRILDVVCFYLDTLQHSHGHQQHQQHRAGREAEPPLLDSDAPLLVGLRQCRQVAAEVFKASLEATAQSISISSSSSSSAGNVVVTGDLGTCSLVASTSMLLQETLTAFNRALSPESTLLEAYLSSSTATGIVSVSSLAEAVLDALIPPLIASCRGSAEGLRLSDTAVFMANNLANLHAVLTNTASAASTATTELQGSGTAAVRSWLSRLQAEVREWEEQLVQLAANDALAACGLLNVLNAARAHKESPAAATVPLTSAKGCTPADLSAVVAAFDSQVLSSSGEDAGAIFARLGSPSTRSRLRRATNQVLHAAYTRVYNDFLSDPTAAPAAASILRRSPDQVATLLDLRT